MATTDRSRAPRAAFDRGFFLICAGVWAGAAMGCFALIAGVVSPAALVVAACAAIAAALALSAVPGV